MNEGSMQAHRHTHQTIPLNAVDLLTTVFVFTVLLMHHREYTTDYFQPLSSYPIEPFLQKMAVGGFLYLSGFKLAHSKSSQSNRQFVANRLVRLYPLYLLALVVFSLTEFRLVNDYDLPTAANVIKHVLGLQSVLPGVFGRDYPTLWFVSVLLLCYAFFIVTHRLLLKPRVFFMSLLLAFLAIQILRSTGARFDLTLFREGFGVYLGFFALGMWVSHAYTTLRNINGAYLMLLGVLSTFALLFMYNVIDASEANWYVSLSISVLILASTVPFFLLVQDAYAGASVPIPIGRGLRWISYSSYTIYLFHRPVWSQMAALWSERSSYQWLFIVGLGVPIILVLAFLIQKKYDALVVRLRHKEQ